MYPRNFFWEEAKIKQRTSSKKQLREIGEEAIFWESRFTSFFKFWSTLLRLKFLAIQINTTEKKFSTNFKYKNQYIRKWFKEVQLDF